MLIKPNQAGTISETYAALRTAQRLGLGTVVSTSGSGDKAEATIDFGSAGVKRLLLRYAPVEKL